MSNKHQQTGRNWSKMVKNLNLSPQAMYFWPKMGQYGQNENFPRHNTTIRCFKAIVPSFWPSFRQFWCAILKKMSKNVIFWAKMAKFWTKKGPKMTKKIFYHNPNLLYLVLNHKLGLKNNKRKTIRPHHLLPRDQHTKHFQRISSLSKKVNINSMY